MGITASGIGSGLDVNSLVSQLVSAESRPLAQIKAQGKTVNAKISAYGQLSSSLASFQTAIKNLSSANLGAYTASTSVNGMLSASCNASASPGNYTINITQLAQRQKLCSPGFADSSSSLGTGTLSIAIAGSAAVTLAPKSNSLQDIADAINTSGLEVSASIVNDGQANGMHLVISSNQTGAASRISISGTDALATLSFNPDTPLVFAYDVLGNAPTMMSQTQAAQDGIFSIDGMRITSASNTITGAIQGVSLQLNQISSAPFTLSVIRDDSATKTAINSVVKSWNDLRSTISTQTAWNDSTKTGAVLHGDSGPAYLLTQLRSSMTRAVTGAGNYDNLSGIGLSFQKDGTLSVNDSKLTEAIASHFSDLKLLFSGSDGIATRLSNLTTNLLGDKGVLNTRTEGLNASLRRLNTRQSSEQARLDAISNRYRAQFTRLDTVLSRMQGTSSYLAQQLAALPKN